MLSTVGTMADASMDSGVMYDKSTSILQTSFQYAASKKGASDVF